MRTRFRLSGWLTTRFLSPTRRWPREAPVVPGRLSSARLPGGPSKPCGIAARSTPTGGRPKAHAHLSHLTSQALALIAAHAWEPGFRLEHVARHCHCSASRLSHVLGKETGAGFRDHVSRVRLERALEGLADPALSVKEAAARAGWRTSDLDRHCLHCLGVLPGEWRRRLFRLAALPPG